MRQIPCTMMRGGTSKGVFFDRRVLPDDQGERDALLLRIIGSPDPRQIDGLGGADPLTSKIVIMDREAPDGCHATYTYGRVAVREPYIGYATNCGNLSAAAAVYAIEEGMVPVDPSGATTTVRLYNSNTDRVLVAHVPTDGRGYRAAGDFAIAGVPGTGSEIRLDFAGTAGANTGSLLPLGEPSTQVWVGALGRRVRVSVVDAAKTTLFVRAEELGLRGNELPQEVTDDQVRALWQIRDAVGELLRLGPELAHVPTPVAVAPAMEYRAFGSGEPISPHDFDLCVRAAGRRGHGMSKTASGTGAVCTAVAAVTAGTVVNELMPDRRATVVRIGHASGIMPLRARYDGDGTLAEAAFSRTARRLVDGVAHLP